MLNVTGDTSVAAWRHTGLVVETATRRGPMSIFSNDHGALSNALKQYGEWAELELSFCRRFVNPGDTILDVGAYVGTHTLGFAETVGPTGRIFSFEAQPASFTLLSENVKANATASVTPIHAAVGRNEGPATRFLDQIDITTRRSFGSAVASKGQTEVPAVALDQLKLTSCALIKIDVEGMEDQVLSGSRDLLQNCAPVIYAECNTVDGGSRTRAVLQDAGYDVWMHLVDAYNPANWRGNQANVFGEAKEAALVGVPAHWRDAVGAMRVGAQEKLFRIETLDDLVACMLLKPQYPREVLQYTTACRRT